MCLPMLRPIFTQSCGKETPCGKSPSHTRVGLQALLDRVTVFAGLRTTLKFNVRQILGTPLRLTYHSQFIRQPLARWFTPHAMDHLSVAKYASISNSETSAARGSAGSLRTPRNKSTVTSQPLLGKQLHKTSQTPSRHIQILSLSVF